MVRSPAAGGAVRGDCCSLRLWFEKTTGQPLRPRVPTGPAGFYDRSRLVLARAASDGGGADIGEGSFSGEWPMNWSLASYEDLGGYYERQVLKEEGMGGFRLQDVMSTEITSVSPDMRLEDLGPIFDEHTGLPVLDDENRLVGVISRRDITRGGETVQDAMSTPPVAAKASNRVADAACLMLKHKIHRIPVVDKQAKVIGIVTRTDIFQALEATFS